SLRPRVCAAATATTAAMNDGADGLAGAGFKARFQEHTMTAKENAYARRPAMLVVAATLALVLAGTFGSNALAADATQQVFPSPEAAASALADAARKDDAAEARQILGPEAQKVISSGDSVADRNAASNFASDYSQMHRLAYDSRGRVILYIGAENWPFPIPLVKSGDGWIFDTPAGEKEILYRRIGSNELFTIATLRELVDAQDEYKSAHHQFARRLLSSAGTHDGLYWPVSAGETPSPIGPLVASATAEGYSPNPTGHPSPFHGYMYKVLTAQGKDAPGGAKSYLAGDRMADGF